MATVKVKFRPSKIEGAKGSIYYQVIHNRQVRQKKTSYRIFPSEWDAHLSNLIFIGHSEERKYYLMKINDKIRVDIKRFHEIVFSLESSRWNYTIDDVMEAFVMENPYQFFFPFMEIIIDRLKSIGKIRTSETYKTTLNSFKRFRNNKDIEIGMIDAPIMIAYETYLKTTGISPNTTSFYMRNLRAVYNRAVSKELTIQRFPFKYVYTGVDRTIKRAVPLSVIKRIKEMDLSMSPTLEYARDMFLFSFYMRGMSFVDMAYLRKKDLSHGILSYRRRKTGQILVVKWEQSMQEIVSKYNSPQSPYLLPIIKNSSGVDERKQYIYAAHNINRSLKIIGRNLGLSVPLTMYVSRHAWASIAKSKNVPVSVISDALGHDSESTTRIYLASLDTMAIDKANRMILTSLHKRNQSRGKIK